MPAKHSIVPEKNGRKSGLRRLVYHALPAGQPALGDWRSIKDQLRRTVARVPEVVIKVKGGGTTSTGVLRYMNYISRGGALITADDKGERVSGLENVKAAHASWDLDLQRKHDRKGEPLHQSFNIIFSMPARTDPARLFEAVQAFAQEHFPHRQYLMVLHTPETDPGKDPPPHPHVHVVLRAEDEDGQRLYIRKSTLRAWRGAFASELRMRGVEANATSRAERGVSLKGRSSAEYHIRERGDFSTAQARRFVQAARDMESDNLAPKPWEVAMAARRRDVLRELGRNATRLREEGDIELAEKVERFARELPPLATERHLMQQAIAAEVAGRQQRDPGMDEERTLHGAES